MNTTYTTRCCCWSLLLVGLTLATAKAENWPRFRGPTGDGISTETRLPVEWNDTNHVAWKTPIPGEGWSSPIIWGERIFVTATLQDGRKCHALCLDAASGQILWNTEVMEQVPGYKERKNFYQGRLGGRYSASPVFADGRIYFLSESGETVVIASGAEFEILARNPLEETCQASMAVSGGRLFIRTDKHLYCIGQREHE